MCSSDLSRLSGDPQAVGARIAVLMARHGGQVEAEDILKDAQKKNSPLHSFFEWDDKTAAHEYRLTQAREIIRSIKIEHVDNETERVITVRAFQVPEEQNRSADRVMGYRPIQDILSDPNLREMKVHEAWQQLEAWKNRYEALTEFADVFRVIEAGPPRTKQKPGRRKSA